MSHESVDYVLMPLLFGPLLYLFCRIVYLAMKEADERRQLVAACARAARISELQREIRVAHLLAVKWDSIRRHRAIQDQPMQIRRWEDGFLMAKGIHDYMEHAIIIRSGLS